MVDPEIKHIENISLPPRLQSPDVFDPDFKDDEHKVPIINMQKALYDILISDKEKRINRLEDRNNQLEETFTDIEGSIKSLDIETGDHIAHLNRQISVQTDKIEEIVKSINFIENLRKEEKEKHLRNVESANEKYETTRVDLTSAIKALNAQINTLEDYKQMREGLREKLRIQDEIIAENAEQVQQRLHSVDRKFKIDRDKLKNEMYSRLLALAGTFQTENSQSISIPIERLMRENIFINNELMLMMNNCLKTKEDYTKMQSVENLRINSMKIDFRDKINHLKTMKLQSCVIGALKVKHSVMKKRLENVENNITEQYSQEKYDNLVESAKVDLETFEARKRNLEVLLHRESVKYARVKFAHSQAELRASKSEEILYDLKYIVTCALKMTDTGEDILDMSETQLISHLLNVIHRGKSQIKCLEVASTETVPRPFEKYAKGDLGFAPDHIDFEDSTISKDFSEAVSIEVNPIDISQVSRVFEPEILLQDYDVVSEDVEEFSSEDTITTNETNEQSPEKHEDISLNESSENEEILYSRKDSINVDELYGEEQE